MLEVHKRKGRSARHILPRAEGNGGAWLEDGQGGRVESGAAPEKSLPPRTDGSHARVEEKVLATDEVFTVDGDGEGSGAWASHRGWRDAAEMSIALEGGVHDARREAAQGAPPVQGRGRVAVRAKAVEALSEHHEAGAAGCGTGVR